MLQRIDIAINERGTDVVLRKLDDLASTLQRLSPRMAASLRGKALRVGINTDKLVKDVAAEVLDKVVHTTPHDTGQARGNWQVEISTNRPATAQLLGHLDYDGDATVAEGKAKIYGTPRALGQTIFISNSLDYIKALNEGWSKQAPSSFVQLAVQAGAHLASDANLTKGR